MHSIACYTFDMTLSPNAQPEWERGELIKLNGKVRVPEGYGLTVYRSDLPVAKVSDPGVEALVCNFPPLNPEALRHLLSDAGVILNSNSAPDSV